MSEFAEEHQRYEEGLIPHDFMPRTEEALALRALIDNLGLAIPFPQPDLSKPETVENMSVDDAA